MISGLRFPQVLSVSCGVALLCGLVAYLSANQLPVISPRQNVDSEAGPKIVPATGPSNPAVQNAGVPAAAVTPSNETWQTLSIGGQRIGFSRTKRQRDASVIAQSAEIRTVQQMKLNLKRFGQGLEMKAELDCVEAANGDLQSFRFELNNSPSGKILTTGRVEGNGLKLETSIDGRSRRQTVPLREGTKSPLYHERYLLEKGLKPGESVAFPVYFPDRNEVADVRLSGFDLREVKLPDGSREMLQKITILEGGTTPTTTTAYQRPGTAIVLTETTLFGQSFQSLTVDQQVALQQMEGAELDLAVSMLIPVTPLKSPQSTTRVTYRVQTPGEEAAKIFWQGDYQKVRVIDPQTVVVTVSAVPLKSSTDRPGSVDREFREKTQLLQTDDEKVQMFATDAAGTFLDPAEVARRMESFVHKKIANKNFSTAFASAAETARRLEGDCTEHAVLLAAMLRCKGIPSRVAAGLVYLPGQDRMGGHMWTEAYINSSWVPLDATLGNGGTAAERLKVADTSLKDDGPLPVMALAPLMKLSAATTLTIESADYQ